MFLVVVFSFLFAYLPQSTTNTGPSICQHVITYWPIAGCPHWASKKVQTVPTTAQHDGLLRALW